MQTSTPHQAEITPSTETTAAAPQLGSPCFLLFLQPGVAGPQTPSNPVSLLFSVATAILFAVVLIAGDAPTQTPLVSLLLVSSTLSFP